MIGIFDIGRGCGGMVVVASRQYVGAGRPQEKNVTAKQAGLGAGGLDKDDGLEVDLADAVP